MVVLVVRRVASRETGSWKTLEAQVRALLQVDIRSFGPLLRGSRHRRGRILVHWGRWVLRA